MRVITLVKPCSRIQMISSWRRTRRWLAPYPPGRSHTASLSFRIHAKLRGWMPWAHLPFIATGAAPSRWGPSCGLVGGGRGDEAGGGDGGGDVVDAHHAGPAR